MARPRRKLDVQGQADCVAVLLKTQPAGWQRECLQAVQLGLQGELSLAQIAQAVGRARSTLQEWFDTFRTGGVEALLRDKRADNPGQPGKLHAAARTQWEAGLQEGRWRTVPQMQRWLQQTHGVKLALSTLYNRLGKAGARLRVPRPSHVRKNPAAALEFRETLPAKLTALALPKGRPVRLWVQDEMRYGLHGFTRRVWGLAGHRPVAPTQQVYQWGYVYGAVGVGLARTQFLLAETVDQAHERKFYQQVGGSDPAALHVLIQDGAGFHLRDGDERLPDNVRIVTLPAYSPELNPVEGLWDQLKDVLCNRVFWSLADLEAALVEELRGFWQDARRVRSLIFDWLLDRANASSR
ncbi:MAG: IS630 family transposase, partial [Acidobacteriota bacterium]